MALEIIETSSPHLPSESIMARQIAINTWEDNGGRMLPLRRFCAMLRPAMDARVAEWQTRQT